MKVICPEHNGVIEIPDALFVSAVNSPLKQLIFVCPVCEDEILITDADEKDAISGYRSKGKSEKTA